MTTTKQSLVREYHFDRANNDEFASDGVAAAYGADGVTLACTTDATNSAIYQNDVLFFDIDLLCMVEFHFKTKDLDSDSVIHLGVGSAFNSDPSAIAAHAFIKIVGDGSVSVETDDGTLDLSASTGFAAADNAWQRAVIDFRTGIQSISPPSKSLGGKSSVQFTCTDANGMQNHLSRLDKHMDMRNYSGGLQLIANAALAGSAASPSAGITIKGIRVEYEAAS